MKDVSRLKGSDYEASVQTRSSIEYGTASSAPEGMPLLPTIPQYLHAFRHYR